MTSLESIGSKVKGFDMFGYVPALLYKGDSAFHTVPGAIISLILQGLIIMNVVQLALAFVSGQE